MVLSTQHGQYAFANICMAIGQGLGDPDSMRWSQWTPEGPHEPALIYVSPLRLALLALCIAEGQMPPHQSASRIGLCKAGIQLHVAQAANNVLLP